MIDSSELTFKPHKEPRIETIPDFTQGLSGPLMIAADKSGRKYIVKYTYPHNAANEYTACWLGHKIGAPVPHACLLKPSRNFPCLFGVAIEFIADLNQIDYENLTPQMKQDLYVQVALNTLIDLSDKYQLAITKNRIYSMDFSEAFYVLDPMMLYAFQHSEETGIEWATKKLNAYRKNLSLLTFHFPELARKINMDPDDLCSKATAAAKRVLDISDADIEALSDELSVMYPLGYALYYEECIHAMQKKMSTY